MLLVIFCAVFLIFTCQACRKRGGWTFLACATFKKRGQKKGQSSTALRDCYSASEVPNKVAFRSYKMLRKLSLSSNNKSLPELVTCSQYCLKLRHFLMKLKLFVYFLICNFSFVSKSNSVEVFSRKMRKIIENVETKSTWN